MGNTYETLTGDNSIIWKGSEASFKTDIATFQEELMISISDDYLQKREKEMMKTNSIKEDMMK